jgi:hypothetical protein
MLNMGSHNFRVETPDFVMRCVERGDFFKKIPLQDAKQSCRVFVNRAGLTVEIRIVLVSGLITRLLKLYLIVQKSNIHNFLRQLHYSYYNLSVSS